MSVLTGVCVWILGSDRPDGQCNGSSAKHDPAQPES
jgi:hypothetical protein